MFVYSLISCEEILSWPIFFACVRTRRYWLRRAATPTVRRSPCTAFPSVANSTAISRLSIATRPTAPGEGTERVLKGFVGDLPVRRRRRARVHEVRERLFAVDQDDGKTLAVAPLELGVARDVDLLELERDLRAHLLEHAPRALAQVAALRPSKA